MGAGLALQIRNKWPKVYKQYCSFCEGYQNGKAIKLLGCVQDVVVDNDLVVANCFGQVYPGSGLRTDYDAWDKILPQLLNDSIYFNECALHFPWMIGCGLAGGDWNIMSRKIVDFFKDASIPVYIHKY